ncbi:hypothetical protein [Sinomonas flava]|uniref:hypothetical protein n=1 Tax=Sinomonas flava TaxID=496857 RepID=UPI0039A403C5
MNGTPRMLNRVLIAVFGLLVFAAGALMLLLAAVPAFAQWWQSWAPDAAVRAGAAFEATHFPGSRVSWLWLIAAALAVLVVLLMVWWVSQQGTGRRDLIAATAPDGGTAPGGQLAEGEVPGLVGIAAAAVDQALRGVLAERKDVLSTAVAAVEFEGRTALRIRTVARQGADPGAIAAEVEQLVRRLDLVMGIAVPVLLHVTSGARARFSRAERVR